MRKIVHIDMDAFYSSVEQRDDPQLRGNPVIVAWRGNRSVVCAASYEARKFGVRSAMPAVQAERLCPNAVFLPPDFPRYRAVSRQVRDIFRRHTDLIEPLSLDEAYLDVTENKTGLPTATQVARMIREQIRTELQLTASAGVAPIGPRLRAITLQSYNPEAVRITCVLVQDFLTTHLGPDDGPEKGPSGVLLEILENRGDYRAASLFLKMFHHHE